MQTSCPTCESIFRFTRAQAVAASGMVQCGVCHHFFNAMTNRCDAQAATEIGASKTDTSSFSKGVVIGGAAAGDSGMPSVLADSYVHLRPPPPWWTTVLWSILILLALVAALAQMAWFNIDKLGSSSTLRPYVEMACQYFPCAEVQQRDLKKIELLSRDVRSHPTRKGALLITAAFVNRADFEQPYPEITLLLADLSGKTIAWRYFKPSEYLPDGTDPESMMAVDVPASMIMEVLDPGKQTVSYRFDFL